MESHRWFNEPPTALRDRLVHLPREKRSLARLLDEVYRYHGQRQGATFKRWGDKTPMNVGCMDEIIEVFPEARFIHLLRDGVDVAHSWSGVEKYAGEVLAPARRWKRAVTSAQKFGKRHPARFLEIRYENLCREPKATLQRVCSFVDASFDKALLSRNDHYNEMDSAQSIDHYENAFRSITTERIGKGREDLDEKQKEILGSVLNEGLVSFGYPPIEV